MHDRVRSNILETLVRVRSLLTHGGAHDGLYLRDDEAIIAFSGTGQQVRGEGPRGRGGRHRDSVLSF